MNKTRDELATEMTIAWINAVGNACTSGKFAGDWLHKESVIDVYKAFYRAICNPYDSEADKEDSETK